MRLYPLAAAALSLMIAAPASAETYRQGTLEVIDPWSRPAAAKMNGAGFMRIANRGRAPDRLLRIETPAARKAEIHRSTLKNGVAGMQRLDQGVAIGPGQAVSFEPGGYHVMLRGLAKAQKGGDRTPATLVFASGTRVEVAFEVRGAAPGKAAPHGH